MWDDVKALNAAAATLATLAVLALVAGVVWWIARLPAFAFREVVVVTPVNRADPAYVEAVVREELAGTFFTLDFDAARRSLAEVPWVKHVALRRQWPSRLEVSLDEYTPFARWNDDALVDAEGTVFEADYDGELPQFEGPDGTSAELAVRFREFRGIVEPLGLALAGVKLTPRGSWSLTATRTAVLPAATAGQPPAMTAGQSPAAGTAASAARTRPVTLAIELGRSEPEARLARFAAAYPRTVGALARRGTDIDYVDLRYRSGFAARLPQAAKPARKLT